MKIRTILDVEAFEDSETLHEPVENLAGDLNQPSEGLVSWLSLFHVPNVALNVLVVFLCHFLHLLSHLSKNELMKGLISYLPKTYRGLVHRHQTQSNQTT